MNILKSQILRHTAGRVWAEVRPKALRWHAANIRFPESGLIVPLDCTLQVRVRRNDVVGRAIFENGVFEPHEVEFVRRYLKPGMVFFDVGANLGQYTLIGAKHVGASGAVHSFEPSSRMFTELNFNVRLNRLSDICRLNQVAVAQNNDVAKLSTYDVGKEAYGSLGTQSWASKIVGYEDVATISLDSYVETRGISHVDLIKIDIEGGELLALRGASKLLSLPEPPAVLCEIADVNTRGFNYAAVDIWDYFVEAGYKLYTLAEGGKRLVAAQRQISWATNLIALHGKTT